MAFISRDPLDGLPGKPTETNPYHYADNDPLNKIDPLGLRATDFDMDDCVSVGSGDCFPLVDGPDQQAHVAGDIKSARNVAIYLPATCQGTSGATPDCDYRTAATQLYSVASKMGSVAVMSWLAYDTPDSSPWGDWTTGWRGVPPRLSQLVNRLSSRGKVVSVIGHSWSGCILRDALSQGMMPENGIFAGSMCGAPTPDIQDAYHPGQGLDTPLKMFNFVSNFTKMWWGCNSGDLVCAGGGLGSAKSFGLSTSPCPGCNLLGNLNHLYFETGSNSLCNIARIVMGRYEEAIMSRGSALFPARGC